MNKIDTKFIALLPESKFPWKISSLGAMVIAINEEHEPREIHSDGSIEIMELCKIPHDFLSKFQEAWIEAMR